MAEAEDLAFAHLDPGSAAVAGAGYSVAFELFALLCRCGTLVDRVREGATRVEGELTEPEDVMLGVPVRGDAFMALPNVADDRVESPLSSESAAAFDPPAGSSIW